MPPAMTRQPAAHEPGLDAGSVVDRLTRLTDPAFLAEAGWDPGTRVLSLRSAHPLLGWRACPSAGCGNALYGRDQECGACRRASAAEPAAPAGGGPAAGRGMRLVPAPPADGLCQVTACGRERRERRYCRAHDERVRVLRSGPSFDEAEWRANEPAIEGPGQVSLHGLRPRAVAEVLYGFQQRTRSGAATSPAQLRQVAWELRRARAVSVEDISRRGPHAAPAGALLRQARGQGVPRPGDRDAQGRVGPCGVRVRWPAHLHRDQPAVAA